MKKRTLLPLFAALVLTGTARSQNPDQPRPDGPSLERLRHEVEELKRAGKHEEAERLEHKAREMMERRKDAEARERKAGGDQEARREKPKAEPKTEPRSERRETPPNPGPKDGRKDEAFARGPMAERLKARIEELRRDGKHEEAGRFAQQAREMWAKHRGESQNGGHGEAHGSRGESHGDKPAVKPEERAMHLAEAAKHLRAAGIPVSPEMLEKFSQRSSGKPGEHPWFSHRGQSDGGSPGGFGERPHFPSKDGAAPAGAPRFDAMQKHFGSRFGRPGFPPAPGMGAPGQPPVPHMPGTAPEGPRVNAMHRGFGGMQGMHERQAPSPGANPGPGAGPAPDAVQNEIRALAKQVQELRAMIQQRGGAQNPAPMPRGGGFQSPDSREHHAAPGAPGAPGANPERRDFPQRAPGEHHPRTEGGHPNPPGNPAIPGERPRGDAPQPR